MTKTFEQVWENCLKIFRDNINHQSYKTWFEPIKPVSLEDNVLTIEVPSQFFYEWLEEHYVEIIAKTIKRELGKSARLEYRVLIENQSKQNPASVRMPAGSHNQTAENNYIDVLHRDETPVKNPFAIPGLKRSQIDPQLNPNYTFDSYVEGDCNRLSRNAGLAVAEKPGGTSFNPLVVYGGVGLGKTHLSHAIGNK